MTPLLLLNSRSRPGTAGGPILVLWSRSLSWANTTSIGNSVSERYSIDVRISPGLDTLAEVASKPAFGLGDD